MVKLNTKRYSPSLLEGSGETEAKRYSPRLLDVCGETEYKMIFTMFVGWLGETEYKTIFTKFVGYTAFKINKCGRSKGGAGLGWVGGGGEVEGAHKAMTLFPPS